MIMFIVLDGLLNQLLVEAHLCFHFLYEFHIDTQLLGVVAKIIILRLVQLKEGMTSQPVYINSQLGIRYENLRDDIFSFGCEELW